jgi:hypothetical protein
MIQTGTRAEIKGYLEGFIQGMINEHRKSNLDPKVLRPTKTYSKEGDIKPFHEALIPNGIITINEFERSFSTKLGSTFEECAKLIAQKFHIEANRTYEIKGKMHLSAIQLIERIKASIDDNGMTEQYPELIQRILHSQDGEQVERSAIADIHIILRDESEAFFEIKSPKPNKGQCLEVTERLLDIHALKARGPPQVKTFYAMAYNPWGDQRSSYTHSFTLHYLDFGNEVLVGREFWTLVGGPGTYEELLEIYREVGREKGPDMLEQLALDY